MTFDEFCQREHKKKVKHFVKFCKATDSPPTIANAVEIFGIMPVECKPIVADAIQMMGGE